MAGLLRAIGFFVSALSVEMISGLGIAAFAIALLIGLRRWPIVLLAGVTAAGAVLSPFLPESVATTSKVAHGLSNVAFVVMLYAVISFIGYSVGRVLRQRQT